MKKAREFATRSKGLVMKVNQLVLEMEKHPDHHDLYVAEIKKTWQELEFLGTDFLAELEKGGA